MRAPQGISRFGLYVNKICNFLSARQRRKSRRTNYQQKSENLFCSRSDPRNVFGWNKETEKQEPEKGAKRELEFV